MNEIKEISFSEIVKKEICSLEYEEHCFLNMLKIALMNNAQISWEENKIVWELKSKFLNSFKFIKKHLKMYVSETRNDVFLSNIKSIQDQRNIYMMRFEFSSSSKDLFDKFEFDFDLSKECCKRAVISSLFLFSGSLSNPVTSSNHLEFRIESDKVSKIFEFIMTEFGLDHKKINRRNKNTFYFKSFDDISDILKLMNTEENMYKFEDFRITRDFYNSLQRLNNLEISNIKKTVKSNNDTLDRVEKLANRFLLRKFNDKEMKYISCLKKYPEESLSKLVIILEKEYDLKITKSFLNHVNRKIKKLFEEHYLESK